MPSRAEPRADDASLAVRGLEREALRELIGSMAGRAPNERVVSAVERGTRGNPLYASEAVRLLSAEGRLEEPREVVVRSCGGAARGARHHRPSSRPTPARDASARGGRRCRRPGVRRDLLGAIAELDPQPLRTASRRPPRRASCSRSQGGGRPLSVLARPRPRDALRRAQPRASIKHHRRAAEVLEARHGSDPEGHLAELAYHFFEGQPDGSGDAPAVEHARRAGEEASRSLAFEEAARLYAMALVASAAFPERGRAAAAGPPARTRRREQPERRRSGGP